MQIKSLFSSNHIAKLEIRLIDRRQENFHNNYNKLKLVTIVITSPPSDLPTLYLTLFIYLNYRGISSCKNPNSKSKQEIDLHNLNNSSIGIDSSAISS